MINILPFLILIFAESTHSVDGGPASWRLTLDQDLFDTLKGNFPSWFQSSSGGGATSKPINPNQQLAQQKHHQHQHQQLVAIPSVIPITIDTKITAHTTSPPTSNANTLQQQQQQQTVILGGGHHQSSSSASPASSVSSNSSKKSISSSLSSCSSSSSSSSCSSSSSSSCSGSSKGASAAATASRFLNKSTSTSPTKSLARTLKAQTQKPGNCHKVGQLVKSASLHSLSSGSSGSSSSSGGSSGNGSSSLLATISASPLTTVELISSAACGGLLATRLSGKTLEHTFQDIILLHETYDDMSEGGCSLLIL